MKRKIKNVLCGIFALAAFGCMGALGATEVYADATTGLTLPNFEMALGASVRKVGTDATKNGIRFTANMSISDYEALEAKTSYDVKYGIAIIPKDYAETTGYSITEENLFGESAVYTAEMTASEAKAVGKRAMITGESDTLMLTYDEETKTNVYSIKVSMVGIAESNLLREFIGTPYIAYKTTAETEYTYELGAYRNGDVANNTRSMTYVAQRAIEDGEDDSSNTLYNAYVKKVETKETTYQVKRYFADGYGGYTYDPYYSEDGAKDGDTAISEVKTGTVGSAISTEYTGERYMGAYELNEEKSTKDPVVYANGKQVVELYYDIRSDIEGSHIHGFGSASGTDGVYQGNGPENLIDGDENTYFWSCSHPTTSSFIVADLGESRAVSTIEIVYGHEEADIYPNATVSYSTDGKNYTVLGNMTSDNSTTTLNFDEISARYIRLACPPNGGPWVKIAEISVSATPVRIEVVETGKATFKRDDTTVDTSALQYNFVYSDGSKSAADGSYVTLGTLTTTPGKQTVSVAYDDGEVALETTQEIGVWYVIKNDSDGSASADWQLMNTYLDGYFTLESDIELKGGNNDTIGVAPYVADRYFDPNGAGQSPDEITEEQMTELKLEVGKEVNYAKKGVAFTGKFDGQGYIVKGFASSFDYDSSTTFLWGVGNYARTPFAYIGEGGYVGNFTLDKAKIVSANDSAFVAGANFGTIENIVIAPNCSIMAQYSRAYAVTAYNYGTVKNVVCHVATLTNGSDETKALNVIGDTQGENSVIENCFVDNEDHSDVLPLYSAENGLGWFYVQDFGMYFGNATYKYAIGVSSTEWDINGTVLLYTAQTDASTTTGIYGHVWGNVSQGYAVRATWKGNGVYELALTENALQAITVGKTPAFGIRLLPNTSYCIVQSFKIVDSTATSITYGNIADPSGGTVIENAIDGDESTYVWFGGTSKSGETPSYIQLDLKKDTEITNVQLLMTQENAQADKFDNIALQYSTDGVTWTDFVEGATYTNSEILVTLETPVTARYVRAVETAADGSNWVVVREFAVNVEAAA